MSAHRTLAAAHRRRSCEVHRDLVMRARTVDDRGRPAARRDLHMSGATDEGAESAPYLLVRAHNAIRLATAPAHARNRRALQIDVPHGGDGIAEVIDDGHPTAQLVDVSSGERLGE